MLAAADFGADEECFVVFAIIIKRWLE